MEGNFTRSFEFCKSSRFFGYNCIRWPINFCSRRVSVSVCRDEADEIFCNILWLNSRPDNSSLKQIRVFISQPRRQLFCNRWPDVVASAELRRLITLLACHNNIGSKWWVLTPKLVVPVTWFLSYVGYIFQTFHLNGLQQLSATKLCRQWCCVHQYTVQPVERSMKFWRFLGSRL